MHGSARPLVFVICGFITSLFFFSAVAAAVVILLVYILPALLWNISSLGLLMHAFALLLLCFALLASLSLSVLSFPGHIQSSGEKRREEKHR